MGRELAAYAANAESGGWRLCEETASPTRSPFQRDRDRIIHATAFRRLKGKTQVFVAHEGDHYRTRLTHSLEVAQVARSIARQLGLDEDLTEAIALAHDLGHTPFGHAGERALDRVMAAWGGFDHNAHTLKIVTRLERHYAAFDGLNLTFETIDGLIKHNGPLVDANGDPAGGYRQRPAPAELVECARAHGIALEAQAGGEAGCAAIADDIAYNAHDIDDGLRAGLFDVIDLADVPLAGTALAQVLKTWPGLERPRLVHETVRRVISAMAEDVIATARRNIALSDPRSIDDIRRLDAPLIAFSPQMAEYNRVLKRFLNRRVYRHEKVSEIMHRAERIVEDLFTAYMERPETTGIAELAGIDNDDERAVAIADHIAGMTDGYALACHRRLFDVSPVFR